MSDWGFDFIRIPMAYPSYLDIDHTKNITPEEVYKIKESAVEKVDRVVSLAHKYNIHVSLNLHRAPGYCVNAGFYEPYNLWIDQEALAGVLPKPVEKLGPRMRDMGGDTIENRLQQRQRHRRQQHAGGIFQ